MVKPGRSDVIKQGKRHNSIIATPCLVRTRRVKLKTSQNRHFGRYGGAELTQVTSAADIRAAQNTIVRKLLHPDAAYLYKNYKTII